MDSHATCSWISTAAGAVRAPAAFIRLMTDVRPFDTVQVAVLDPDTLVPIERMRIRFAEAQFTFVRRSKGQPSVEIREIEVID